MKKLSLLLALLFTTIIWAQAPEKMSYQAVVRDANEALVTNQTVGMQISILQGSTTGNAVYEETQTPTSNANGLISLEIGTGTIVSGDFTTIDWSNNTYFIKTEIDPTGGTNYTITGTSQLLSVPYAMHAKTAANVSGLEKITESDGPGWRLIGKDPANYGNLGRKAVDLSHSPNPSSTKGATAPQSIAMGSSTTASGVNSIAMGNSTESSGYSSLATGNGTNATGNYSITSGWATDALGIGSIAMGDRTEATGDYSTAMGSLTRAESYVQTTLGVNNTIVTGDVTTFVPTDRLFVIGNGTNSSNKSDALTILKNGTITAPSLDIAEITDDKSLITKEYFDTNNTAMPATGLTQVTENGQTGWRLPGQDPVIYGNIGNNSVDLTNAVSPSANAGATGESSITMGHGTRASGDYSVAMGEIANASGKTATAMGYRTWAEGDKSTTMGQWTIAKSYGQTSLGIYNETATGNLTSSVPTDRLFVIGNGTGWSDRSNALVMLKNGNTTINGDLKVDEVNAPDSGTADMKAYIYGLAGGNSTDILSVASSDGFSYVWVNTGHYRIYFDVPMARTKYIAVATLHDGIGFINLIRQHNYIDVKTYNTSGTLSNRAFYFVVYKK